MLRNFHVKHFWYYFRENSMMKALLTVLTLVICLNVQAQFTFEENNHYTVVAEQKTAKPEVKEFFSLFCSHCFQFEPFMDSVQAALPKGMKLEKSHVDYLPRNDEEMQNLIVRAFLVMRELNMESDLVKQFFAAYHIKGVEFKTQEDLKQLFVANDVPGDKFDALMSNKRIAQEAEAMSALWEEKKVLSVPTIVVNGKYRINMSTLKNVNELKAITLELLTKD